MNLAICVLKNDTKRNNQDNIIIFIRHKSVTKVLAKAIVTDYWYSSFYIAGQSFCNNFHFVFLWRDGKVKLREDRISASRQSYKRNLFLGKTKSVLNSLTVHYFNLDQNNTLV